MGQGAGGIMALVYVSTISSRHGKELAMARPEHAPVEALTREEQGLTEAYERATRWSKLPKARLPSRTGRIKLLKTL